VKVLLLLIVGGGCLFLLASSCSVTFDTSTVATSTVSPALDDVLAIQAATNAPLGSAKGQPVLALVRRASGMNRERSVALIRQQLPTRADLEYGNIEALRGRIGHLALRTSAGAGCRAALLRFLARDQWLLQRLSREVAQKRWAWKAVNRFGAGMSAGGRSYSADLKLCIAAAPAADRYAIGRAMHFD
jgi:hypothetical protein